MRLVRIEYWNPSTGTVRTGSTGHGESLADMETYLLPLTAALAGGALGSGVVHGLRVTATVGQQGLTVGTGLALGGKGQPILLSDGGAVVVDPNAPPLGQVQNVPLALVGSGGAQLPTSGLTGAQVLTLTAREALDAAAGASSWSLVHAPWLRLVAQGTFTDDGTSVPLALVTLDATGAVTTLEAGPRRQVSPAVGSLTLRRTAVAAGQTPSVGADAGPSLRARPDGGLDVVLPGSQAGAALSVEGTTGRVGIGIGTDRLSIGEPGDGGGLDVPRRMRVRQGGDASAGMWFWQNAVPDAAFVGMSDDSHVGLWGKGVGWGLTMDVGTGALRASGALTLPAGATVQGEGRLHIAGDEILFLLNHDGVVIGKEWGGNGNLTVEGALRASGGLTLPGGGTIQGEGRLHITGDEILFLLNRQGVVVGKGWGGNGNLTVEGALRASGGLTLPGGGTIQGEGRLHITGDEILYLLNRQGVIVGREWGGTGNLVVEGPQLLCNGAAPPPAWSGGGVSTHDLFAGGAVYVGSDFANPACAFYSDGTKHFVIDHPLDPENRSLIHVCIEGPEAAVYYRGSGRLTGGRADVELPEYFEALTRVQDRTVMLTAVCDDDEPVAVLAASPLRDGRFTVRAADGSNPGQRFHWEVKAVRADVAPLVVEPVKRSHQLAGVG